jgi:hypothetical protein
MRKFFSNLAHFLAGNDWPSKDDPIEKAKADFLANGMKVELPRINESNYKSYLRSRHYYSHISGDMHKKVHSLTEQQRIDLLHQLLTVNHYSVGPDDLNAINADRVDVQIILRAALDRNAEQKRIDDAVAVALAKQAPKATIFEKATDGSEGKRIAGFLRSEDERLTPDPEIAKEHSVRIAAMVNKIMKAPPMFMRPADAKMILDSFANGGGASRESVLSMATMVEGAFPKIIPATASPEQVYRWASMLLRELWNIPGNHPTYKTVCNEIETHNEDVSMRQKMEGVVTEMVRPSSINKKPKTK